MTYLLFMVGLVAVVGGLPALLFLFLFQMPLLEAVLFGFLTGSLVLGALEMLGLLSGGIARLSKKKPKQ